MYEAPQTPDGRITRVAPIGAGALAIEVSFRVPRAFRQLVEGREGEIVFAARSRLARLGLNVAPRSEIAWQGDRLALEAEVSANVLSYDIEPWLPEVLLPGVRVGRLVFCPQERRLTSEEIDRAVIANELQLPAAYSVDYEGRFRIRPDGHVYDLAEPLSLQSLTTIMWREHGKDLLNRVQLRRAVDRIVLPPGDGVITSCSMFLHKHYVVLESQAGPLGQHLDAVVLDPVSTRGTNVFLEFFNGTEQRIVNPAVAAAVYRAAEALEEPRVWFGVGAPPAAVPAEATEADAAEAEYQRLADLFDRFESSSEDRRYSHRLVAVVDDLADVLDGGDPLAIWRYPADADEPAVGADVSAREVHAALEEGSDYKYGTGILDQIAPDARATLLLGYFPSLVEHTQICAAALAGKIKRLVFRRASYEHGSFFSARDHGRLADYAALNVEIFWCNDERRHVVTHVFRGLRGYFVEPRNVERFQSALILAVYGSSKPLKSDEVEKVRGLLGNLRTLFGEDISILTGGGPGAMQQATTIAHEMGMMVGASFIETVDQETNQTAEFYQTFQGRSRQARQRWFEVASFHLFFMGGVGTLEEVGLTLTDMKLGVIELSPVVFFGRHDGSRYWKDLRMQFRTMVAAGRAPAWLLERILVTDDPDEVPRFYKRILELG